MGQKIHPKGYRIGTVFTWSSRWFADKRLYRALLYEDVKIREELFRRLKSAGLSEVEIERSINKVKITLHVARPGVVIGRGGSGLEEIKKYLEAFVADVAKPRLGKGEAKQKLELSVEPVKEPNLQAYLVATTISDQLAKRLPQIG